MTRTISVKGVGKACVAPDQVVLQMNMVSRSEDYEGAMLMETDKLEQLADAVERLGFEKESLKTTSFNVETDYEWDSDRRLNVFVGYRIKHEFKLEFDLDIRRLSSVLSAVSSCSADPEISVKFTVKDAEAVNEALLRSATENAKRKAQVLCSASGHQLGQLLSISYNWAELNIYSKTDFQLDDYEYAEGACYEPMAINPDDIKVSDSATFVWEIDD